MSHGIASRALTVSPSVRPSVFVPCPPPALCSLSRVVADVDILEDIHVWQKATYAGVAFLAVFFGKLMVPFPSSFHASPSLPFVASAYESLISSANIITHLISSGLVLHAAPRGP